MSLLVPVAGADAQPSLWSERRGALPRCIACGDLIAPFETASYDPWDRMVHEQCRAAAPWAGQHARRRGALPRAA